MPLSVRTVEYFYVRVKDSQESGYQLLAQLASEAVSLLAFSAVPFGPNYVELTIFPDRTDKFVQLANKFEWGIGPPQHALLVQGDDQLGALADIQRLLAEANVMIYASTGVTDGSGRFGYLIYFREDDYLRAEGVLGAVKLLHERDEPPTL